MAKANLVVRFKMVGQKDAQVRAAVRIRVDGTETMAVTNAETGTVETIRLRDVESLRILSLCGV